MAYQEPITRKKEDLTVDFDAEKVLDLLEIVHKTKDLPTLSSLNQAAMVNLTIMSLDVAEEIAVKQAAARKKAEEEAARKAAEEKRRLEIEERSVRPSEQYQERRI